LNLKELKEILQMLAERDIADFELEEAGTKLRITRATPPAPVVPLARETPVSPGGTDPGPGAAPATAPPPPTRGAAAKPAPVPSPAVALDESETGLTVVKSPIVGTFYRSPDPNSPPFVSVGDVVKVGQVLCIIEAMKLMNEIEAEVAGEVVKIHHDSGQPVQYGEPLFALRPPN
jgi:acetyl-CoA carboxylase biotin carboxyl carrier protein